MATINNYRGKKLLKSNFEGVDIRERIFSGYKREKLSIPADPSNAFMNAQRKIYDHLKDSYYSFSAPTSTGKSFIMRIFIKQQILSGAKQNFALIVSTKALVNHAGKLCALFGVRAADSFVYVKAVFDTMPISYKGRKNP